MASYDRTTEDLGNLVAMDHLDLTVDDQPQATLFYITGLGLTRDPYMSVGLENMWVNAGRQQFHLPTRSTTAQVVRGRIGFVTPDLEQLRERLERIRPRLDGTNFACVAEDGYLLVTCPWGNRFDCVGAGDVFRARLGVPYVEFNVPAGAAKGIVAFYDQVLGAKAELRPGGRLAAVVRAGYDQSLVFIENPAEWRPYDGHHVAVYVTDFSAAHTELERRGLVTEESDAHQFRFKDIVDPETGDVLYELEHEVRSLGHPMFGRPLVNRDPSVTLLNYARGAEQLTVG